MNTDNFFDTPATLTGEEISPQLYRTQDAAEMAGIQAAESRTARRIFLKIADRLQLAPADERREAKGGSPQKFWTPAQDSEPVNDIDRVGSDNLRDVFKLILEVNDADKLRRVRDFADARIAALEGKKIMPTEADA